MATFDPAMTKNIVNQREVELTTFGRKTGKPSRRITWVFGDDDHVYIRSGGGFTREWPKNLRASGRGILHVNGTDLPIRAVLLTDAAEGRRVGFLGRAKYGELFPMSEDGGEPYPGETTTFELFPEDD